MKFSYIQIFLKKERKEKKKRTHNTELTQHAIVVKLVGERKCCLDSQPILFLQSFSIIVNQKVLFGLNQSLFFYGWITFDLISFTCRDEKFQSNMILQRKPLYVCWVLFRKTVITSVMKIYPGMYNLMLILILFLPFILSHTEVHKFSRWFIPKAICLFYSKFFSKAEYIDADSVAERRQEHQEEVSP